MIPFRVPKLQRWIASTFSLLILFIATLALAIACASSSPPSETTAPPPSTLASTSTPAGELGLGTNLSGIADWSTQLPFIDGFKSSRRWLTQCKSEETGCSGGWATDEQELLDLDEDGWVRSLPEPEDPPEYTQAGTLLYREINGRYPGGKYLVLYEGEGTIEYRFDADKDESASQPGRDVIDVTPSGNGIYLIITSTDPNGTGDYIRNIHVIPEDAEDIYETQIFNPAFVEKIQPFQSVRFMDWMDTNNSDQVEWSDRPILESSTYAQIGVPVELLVEFANQLDVNPWFCMPHQATDEYIRNFAEYVKVNLNPELTVYVELSNEVWNWQFDQAHYALEQGQSRWGEGVGDAYMQWYGMRTAQMADIWNEVFADDGDRLITILSTQTAWRGLETAALDCPLWVEEGNTPCYQHVDAYGITGYFSGGLNDDDHREQIVAWLDDDDGGFANAVEQLERGTLLSDEPPWNSLAGIRDTFNYHAQVAEAHGLQMVAYEAGQHIVRPDDEVLTDFFLELNRRPEMYDLYTQLLNNWKDAGGSLFMNFSDIGQPSKWGSWGVLEYVAQDGSPRYDALIDFMTANNFE